MVGIVGFNSVHVMQYMYKYTDVLDALGLEYELVYWDRTEEGERCPFERYRVLRLPTHTELPFYRKLAAFVRYARFMRRSIAEAKYDKLVVLTSQTAVALTGVLGRYKGRYIFDYRDVTREYIASYKKLIGAIARGSAFTAISSQGFARFIEGCPADKLIMSHNIRVPEVKFAPVGARGGKIRLVFWGILRQTEYRKAVCRAFGRDARFEVVMHGSGVSSELDQYCRAEGLDVRFTGRYPPEAVDGFAKETDVLVNLYENDREMRWALPVKLMDGLRYGLPMLVSEGSFLAEYVAPYGIALALDVNSPDAAQRVADWYASLDLASVRAGCLALIERVRREEDVFREAARAFFMEVK